MYGRFWVFTEARNRLADGEAAALTLLKPFTGSTPGRLFQISTRRSGGHAEASSASCFWPSVITSKPAINDHFKTGQRSRAQNMKLFYRDGASSCKFYSVSADRKSTRLNSSHRCISYAVFCLKKKK